MNPLQNDRTQRLRPGRSALLASLVLLSFSAACKEGGPAAIEELTEVSLEEVFASTVEDDIQFGSAPDESGAQEALLLDLHYPTNGNQTSRPAVIWLHGGSYREGHKGEMTEFARRFARRGYVAVSANYRLREGADFDYADPDDELATEVKRDAQHDIQAAVRWLRAATGRDLRVDPDRIYVVGYSAGATTALYVAARPDDPGTSGNPGPSSNVAGAAAISAYIESDMLEAIAVPTLLIHGENDTKVPFTQMQDACTATARCQLVSVPGGAHNMLSLEKENIIADLARFLLGLATSS